MPVHMTTRESLRMFGLADIWAARTDEAVRLVSANDHVHAHGSAHYAGLALDFQSSDPDALSATFRQAGYRVHWRVPGHFGHVHVEQDQSSGNLLIPRPDHTLSHSSSSKRPRGDQRVGG
jgi:hypothetical protein